MTRDIINEIRTGEWIVVDGRTMRDSVFYDCVLVLHGNQGWRTKAVDCTFDRCDLIGPWHLPPLVCQANLTVHKPSHEPEVVSSIFAPTRSPAKRWRWPGLVTSVLWAYIALVGAAFIEAVVRS